MPKSSWDTKPDLFTDSSMLLVEVGGIEPPSNMPYFTTLPYGYNNSLNQRFFLVALLAARSIGVGFLRDIIVSLISNIIYPAYAG